MDGNFSLILSNDGGTRLTVLSKGKQLNIKLSGEVSKWDSIKFSSFLLADILAFYS